MRITDEDLAPPITDEQLERIKLEHPDEELHLLHHDPTGVEVVVKAPKEGEWRRFRQMQQEPENRPAAARQLLMLHVVFPPAAEFQATVQRRPGLVESFGEDLAAIAGVSRATTRRKL